MQSGEKIWFFAKNLNIAKIVCLLPNFIICNFPVVKNINFETAISTKLRILKIDNFYCFKVQSSQKIRTLAKNLNSAKNSDFCLASWFPDKQWLKLNLWPTISSQNSETFSTFIISKCRAIKNQNFGQWFKCGKKFCLLPNFVIFRFPVVKKCEFWAQNFNPAKNSENCQRLSFSEWQMESGQNIKILA